MVAWSRTLILLW